MAIVVPGVGGSGDAHWQTLWERADPSLRRFRPASWDAPDLANWLRALDRCIAAAERPPLLIAHSLGCLLVAHWAAHADGRAIRGAFLVAPPDPEGPAFPPAAGSFRDVPDAPLPFPSLVIASRDDPYASLDQVRGRAAAWQAGFVDIGAHGHINGDSGLGPWPQGKMLFEAFRAGTDPRPAA